MANEFFDKPRAGLFTWLLRGLLVVVVLVIGGYGGIRVNAWWAQRQADQTNLYATFAIIQYNLQQGRLLLPPELQPKPVAPPKPAEAPAVPPTPPAPAVKK